MSQSVTHTTPKPLQFLRSAASLKPVQSGKQRIKKDVLHKNEDKDKIPYHVICHQSLFHVSLRFHCGEDSPDDRPEGITIQHRNTLITAAQYKDRAKKLKRHIFQKLKNNRIC